jgi:transposase
LTNPVVKSPHHSTFSKNRHGRFRESDLLRKLFETVVARCITLLYEAANVMLTRYKGQLKLKDWAFAIARRSTMRKARVALARRLAIIMHAMLRDGTEFTSA